MMYPFEARKMNVEGHEFWMLESKALKGCVAQGDTFAKALSEFEDNEQEWIATAKEVGIPIPDVSTKNISDYCYSGKFTVRVSKRTHKEIALAAEENGISINQFVNDAVIQYLSENHQRTQYKALAENFSRIYEQICNKIIANYSYDFITQIRPSEKTVLENRHDWNIALIRSRNSQLKVTSEFKNESERMNCYAK